MYIFVYLIAEGCFGAFFQLKFTTPYYYQV